MKKRPNIVFLITEHTGARPLAADSPCLKPNLDALAREGVRFSRCYTPNAVCSPARASLMTSLYPSAHGMWDCAHTQRPEWLRMPPGRFAHFAESLGRAGYCNGYFGKWHVEQTVKLENFGWREYDCKPDRFPCRPEPESRVILRTEGYPDHLLAGVDAANRDPKHPAFEHGMEFIRSMSKKNAPFCCFISTFEAHDPYIALDQFWRMYKPEAVPLSPTLRDEPRDKPEIIRRLRAVSQGMSEDDWRRLTAAYLAVLTFIDSETGRLLDALKETGLNDNTVVVFTSDHGDMLGAHGIATKGVGTAYEEVYNVPLIIRAPGMASGGEDGRSIVSLLDVAPTLLDLCGAEPLPEAQGRSLRPLLEKQRSGRDWDEGYAEFFGQRFVYTQRIVWHRNWKYVFNPGGIDELYNLELDPFERRNLAAAPAHKGVLREMCSRMWRKMKAVGDMTLLNTGYPTLRLAPVGPGATE